MSRNPKIEEILQLWFESDHGTLGDRAKFRKQRDDLILECIGKQPLTVDDVLNGLWGQYRDYRKEQRAHEKLITVRSAIRGN